MGMCMPKLLKLASICSVFLLYIQIKSAVKTENDVLIGNRAVKFHKHVDCMIELLEYVAVL